jgi:hypothetical protein
MSLFDDDIEARLVDAARLIEAGDKKQARLALRDIIHADPGNITAWELLLGACFSPQEEITCCHQAALGSARRQSPADPRRIHTRITIQQPVTSRRLFGAGHLRYQLRY